MGGEKSEKVSGSNASPPHIPERFASKYISKICSVSHDPKIATRGEGGNVDRTLNCEV